MASIALYDGIADRWLVSQFTTVAPYHQCIAVSQTNNPTGSWYLYDFWHATNMNDIRISAYGRTAIICRSSEFANGASFVGLALQYLPIRCCSTVRAHGGVS
jgi:hypothetical protein